jgi:hypothetical protein
MSKFLENLEASVQHAINMKAKSAKIVERIKVCMFEAAHEYRRLTALRDGRGCKLYCKQGWKSPLIADVYPSDRAGFAQLDKYSPEGLKSVECIDACAAEYHLREIIATSLTERYLL